MFTCLDETVATNTFFADVPTYHDRIMSHSGASRMVQLYSGKTSQFLAVFPMMKESNVTLEDSIRQAGARNVLFSNKNGKAYIDAKVCNILCCYTIADQQSKLYHHHQNYVEQRIQEVLAQYWLLYIYYVVCLLNHMAIESLD